MSGEMLVLAEHRQGVLREISFELVAAARAVTASSPAPVAVLLLGAELDAMAAELARVADRVIAVEHEELDDYDAEAYLAALVPLLAARQPSALLVGHTACGMDLAPALGVRLGVPVVTDCLGAVRQGGQVTAERQLYGGKIHARLELRPAPTVLLTVRPGAFVPPAEAGSGEVERVARPTLDGRRGRRLLGYELSELEDVDIAAAEILVSVGRGVGKPENMDAVEAFATAVGATLSCSRPVADKGWLPKSRQVGTSGKAVRPKVYVALGISGAYQHVAGMRNAGTIIAVNRDPAAPIFDVAHYGVVGDMFDLLEPLAKRLSAS